jgi:hypothetical protein
MITVNIQVKIEYSVLENIFVTALEGGSNYWYFITDREIDKIRQAVPKEECEPLSTAMFKAIMEHDVEVYIHDIESKEVLGSISKRDIPYRLERVSRNADYSWALLQEIKENGDAESSDIVFQYLVMCEAVFG